LKLQPFLTQARLYLRYKKKSLPNEYDKVLGIATCLGGSALDWFEPRMREFLAGDVNDAEFVAELPEETKRLFGSYDEFEKELRKILGAIDEKKTGNSKATTS
jgi:hypothetical protein